MFLDDFGNVKSYGTVIPYFKVEFFIEAGEKHRFLSVAFYLIYDALPSNHLISSHF
jgi:hypothetical protein